MRIVEARRIALAAQGFGRPHPAKPTQAHFKRILKKMSVLQLDSVQYVCRSHYLPVFARLGVFDTEDLDKFTYGSSHVLETWAHEASLIPMEHEPLLRWRKARSEQGQVWAHLRKVIEERPDYPASLRQEIAERGPMHAGQLSEPRKNKKGTWWSGRSDGKVALEWMFHAGQVGARRDSNFRRVYNLPERIIPDKVLAIPTPLAADAHRELLMLAAESHGIASLDCLADYYRIKITEARPRVAELVEEGRLVEVEVEGWAKPGYLHPKCERPKSMDVATVLSPFDPVVWNRKRASKLYDFEYRIEIYVPQAKRKYGYYVLPFLLGDTLKARVEVKAERKTGRLLVLGAWIEKGQDKAYTAERLADSLRRLATQLKLNTLTLPRKGDLARLLAASLRENPKAL